MKTKRIKATLHEAMLDPGPRLLVQGERKLKMRTKHDTVPDYGWVYLLPADAESYERMVEQAAAALAKGFVHAGVYNDADRQYQNNMRRYYRTRARTAIRAIGITKPKKTKGTQ